jgi:hypothetical protein
MNLAKRFMPWTTSREHQCQDGQLQSSYTEPAELQ